MSRNILSRKITLAALLAVLMFAMSALSSRAYAAEGSVVLPDPAVDSTPNAKSKSEKTVIAGGCYWGTQLVFQHIKGVKNVTAGFSGGSSKEEAGSAVPAESVQITFDPSQLSYGQLLKVFFSVAHDPTQLNRQGPDTGPQYRSAIFYSNEEQKHIAESYIAQLSQAKVFPAPLVTQVVPLKEFHAVDASQQNFATLHPDNPYIVTNDVPKVEHLRQEFPALYKK